MFNPGVWWMGLLADEIRVRYRRPKYTGGSPIRVVPRTANTTRQLRTRMWLLALSKMLDQGLRARPQFLAPSGVRVRARFPCRYGEISALGTSRISRMVAGWEGTVFYVSRTVRP